MSAKKKVLMIANDFPPIGGAGVQRSLYFAKYLQQFGWLPVVLTVRDVAFPAKDPTLLTELPPEVQILRTESLELRRLAWHFGRIRSRLHAEVPSAGVTPKDSVAAVSDVSSPRHRELGRALKRWCFVPDDRVLWAPFAVPKALHAIKKNGISAIFATIPCYSSGVIGEVVSRRSGLPLLLDMRDPWTRDPYLPSPTHLHAWLNSRLERKAIARATRVVVISDEMRNRLCDAYPAMPAKKFVTITNGYDREKFSTVVPQDIGGRFVVAYSGSLYAHHRAALRAFCSAWSQLCERDADFERQSELWLIGRCDPEIRQELASWPALKATIFGYRPHNEALQILLGASALLLLIKNLDPGHDLVTIPGKLFEYIGANSPILMIGPEGDAADIVRNTAGCVHRERDLEQIAESLAEIYRGQSTPESPTAESPSRGLYDRKHLTSCLASQLDDLVAGWGLSAV